MAATATTAEVVADALTSTGDGWRNVLEKWAAGLPCEAGGKCEKCMPCVAKKTRAARRAMHREGK